MEKIPVKNFDFLESLGTQFTSVAQMIATRASEIPDQIHVKFYGQTRTYAETNSRANKVANFLKRKGAAKGDIISLMIMNSPAIYDAMFGAQKLGCIAGLINFALKGPEIAHILDDSKPEIVFIGSEFMSEFARGLKKATHKPKVVEVITGDSPVATIACTTLDDIIKEYPDAEALVPQELEDPFLLIYSSGTTGLPKGIILSNRAQLSVCRDMTRLGLVTGNDVMLILLPMFHSNPICVWTLPMTFCGQTLCIQKGFSPADFWPAITDNGITILMGVPAMYNYVYNAIDPDTIDRKNLKLKWAFCGAAPLTLDLIKGFKKRFNVDIIEGYGLTEGSGVSTANPPLGNRKPGSIGLALAEQEIRIMDGSLEELPLGQSGEICIKGNANMNAYLNNTEATRDTLKKGWMKTGDIGYQDEEGYFYVVDRKKDMINRGGENIYPREIEIVLEAHPDILASAVVGVADEALGERVKAVLEVAKQSTLTQDMVKEYLSDKLAKYKIPEFIEFMDQLPRNPTGKILKQDLRG
jgi:long-chain acyl-CoA synthetase